MPPSLLSRLLSTSTSPASPSRGAVLSAWRDYIEVLRRLPPELAAARKADAAARVRAGDGDKPDVGLKKLLAAVATLRATTAKRPGERRAGRSGVYVLRRGQLVEGEGGGESAKRAIGAGKLSPGEAMDRHKALLRRQYFGRDPPPGTRLF